MDDTAWSVGIKQGAEPITLQEQLQVTKKARELVVNDGKKSDKIVHEMLIHIKEGADIQSDNAISPAQEGSIENFEISELLNASNNESRVLANTTQYFMKGPTDSTDTSEGSDRSPDVSEVQPRIEEYAEATPDVNLAESSEPHKAEFKPMADRDCIETYRADDTTSTSDRARNGDDLISEVQIIFDAVPITKSSFTKYHNSLPSKGRRANTTGDIIESGGKSRRKRIRRNVEGGIEAEENYRTARSSPCPIESREIADSDIDLGDSISFVREKIVQTKDENSVNASAVMERNAESRTDQHLALDEEGDTAPATLMKSSIEKEHEPEYTESPQVSQLNVEVTRDAFNFMDAVDDDTTLTNESVAISTPLSASPIEEKQQAAKLKSKLASKKSLADLCASTSKSYFKPRIGLSKRSKIESLHKYLKTKNV